MVPTDAAVRAQPSAASPSFTRACALLGLLFALGTSTSFAQPSAADVGIAASGLPGLVYTGLPTYQLTRPELMLSTSAGYGITERFSSLRAAQHRIQGALAIGFVPLDWLEFSLRFDGRLELHPNDGMGSHLSGHGDPRLRVRVGRALSPAWSLGGELEAWFPGADAPSLEPKATSLDAKLLAAYANSGWTVLGLAGVRWDNSAEVGLDRTRLRVGDRISLGLSSSSALLLALGLSKRVSTPLELYAELSGDVLFGKYAPKFTESPLRAAAGARYALVGALQGEVTALLSLSERPSEKPSAPWYPVEPRFTLVLGVHYTFGLGPAPVQASKPGPNRNQPLGPAKPVEPEFTSLRGKVMDDHGEPLPEARVLLQASSGGPREAITDAYGNYQFENVPLGAAQLEVNAVGFAPQTWNIDVVKGMPPETPRTLAPKAERGVLRGLIRSFLSEPLQARISVRDARGKLVAEEKSAADGHVEIELAPGRYRVTIDAPGYKTFVQSVQIKGNDVAVLNADLRKQP